MVAALLLGLRPVATLAQFVSRTTMVPVYATVTDAGGHLLADLPREAFQVSEDGTPRPVDVFGAGKKTRKAKSTFMGPITEAENLKHEK